MAPAERVFEKIDLEPTLKDGPNPKAVPVFESLTFDHVSFQYVADKPVLSDLCLTVNAGESIALVGPSGGGKSTLVELIPRFLDPSEGRILFNGTDLRELSLKQLRQNVALVSQDTVLFGGSIADNIRFGRLDASDEEVRQAAKKAFLMDWIDSTPAGFDTQVGERGGMVSGGQKQRISIARAFLKDAPILILDEATSALDSESEQMIKQAVLNVMQNRTVFIIAHRLSTIQTVNRIAVMSAGKIVEIGPHQELLQQNGLYTKLHQLQFNNESLLEV